MRHFLRRFLGSGGAARSVLAMVSGTGLSQVITMLLLLPLARLYPPEAFGFFALFQSVVGVGTTVASMRYDQAIVLPKADDDARVLRQLSLWSIAGVSLLITAGALLLQGWLTHHYHSQSFARWLTAAGLAVFVTAQVSNIQFWLTRTKRFGIIASNRVLQSLAVGISQLLAYLLVPNVGGLVIGLVFGSLVAFTTLLWRSPSAREPVGSGAPTKWAMAKRYKKMPLLNGPNALIDSLRTMGINYLIGQIAVADLGEYSMAWRLTIAPVTLIQGAIAQVFLQRMAVAKRGELTTLLKRVVWRIGAVAAPLFVVYYFLAPWLLPLVLGGEWDQSGSIAQALMPWAFMLAFSAPSSNVFIVAEKQQWILLYSVVYTVAPLWLLASSKAPLLETVQWLGWLMSALLIGMLAVTWVVARSYDRPALRKDR